MEEKSYLVIPRNTGQLLLVEKIFRDHQLEGEIVPAPARPGLVCTRAVKIGEEDLNAAKQLLLEKNVVVVEIVESIKLKLQGLLDEKLVRV